MKTVAYLRVSTPQQDASSQRLAILEYARKHDFHIDDFIARTHGSRARVRQVVEFDDQRCCTTSSAWRWSDGRSRRAAAETTKETGTLAGNNKIQESAPSRKRYSRLAPLDVETETLLAHQARQFFSPMFQLERRKLPPGQSLTPASGKDFVDYLSERQSLAEEPDRYLHHIRGLLDRMVQNDLLVETGVGRGADFVMLPKSYYALSELSTLRARGVLWLAKTLGGRFVHRYVSPAVVHVVGENNEGEGSGIVFDEHHVLTCGHVVSRMKLAPVQAFQGRTATVEEVFQYESADVAVIRIKESLTTVPGLGFVDPVVSQKVYRFGYSRVPCSVPSNTGTSPLVMQSGEVTNESVRALGGGELFLYSAISRPGDSGGAIVSDDGYVVGMTTELSDSRVHTSEGEEVFSPHYAGIPSHVLARAVDEFGLGVQIPIEIYE